LYAIADVELFLELYLEAMAIPDPVRAVAASARHCDRATPRAAISSDRLREQLMFSDQTGVLYDLDAIEQVASYLSAWRLTHRQSMKGREKFLDRS
jgi:hypothetical protein